MSLNQREGERPREPLGFQARTFFVFPVFFCGKNPRAFVFICGQTEQAFSLERRNLVKPPRRQVRQENPDALPWRSWRLGG